MSLINNLGETKSIKALFILEIIGRPAPHLIETLEKIIEGMGREKGVSIVEKKIMEPILMKEQKDLFATHAEIEVEVDGAMQLALLMFKYMPANVEVIYPERITLSNNGWSEILTELTRRLHNYDEIARMIQIQKQELEIKIKELEERLKNLTENKDKTPLKKEKRKAKQEQN